jgi:hypothetical protein
LLTDIAFGTIRDQGFESYAIYHEVSNLHLQFTIHSFLNHMETKF